jgi:hypothetical protein
MFFRLHLVLHECVKHQNFLGTEPGLKDVGLHIIKDVQQQLFELFIFDVQQQ